MGSSACSILPQTTTADSILERIDVLDPKDLDITKRDDESIGIVPIDGPVKASLLRNGNLNFMDSICKIGVGPFSSAESCQGILESSGKATQAHTSVFG